MPSRKNPEKFSKVQVFSPEKFRKSLDVGEGLSALDKHQLFDVWTTHTEHCSVCQKALKRIENLKILIK